MQTRSKTALARKQAQQPANALEVISDEIAVVEHEAVHPRTMSTDESQQLLTAVHAHAMQAQAVAHVNHELRLQQAFIATEARLHATAKELVHAHCAEQAQGTRRELEGALQNALVEAHRQAHDQALTAANDRLEAFVAETRDKIQSHLKDAVNELSSQGVAYIESAADEKFSSLSTHVDKIVKKATADSLMAVHLSEVEKRCNLHAETTAINQTRMAVSQLEVRLLGDIEQRLASVETRADSKVTEAIVRAEAHTNSVVTRMRDGADQALRDLKNVMDRQSSDGTNSVAVGALTEHQVTKIVDARIDSALRATRDLPVMPRCEQLTVDQVRQLVCEVLAESNHDSPMAKLINITVRSFLSDMVKEQLEARLLAYLDAAEVKMLAYVDRLMIEKVYPRLESLVFEKTRIHGRQMLCEPTAPGPINLQSTNMEASVDTKSSQVKDTDFQTKVNLALKAAYSQPAVKPPQVVAEYASPTLNPRQMLAARERAKFQSSLGQCPSDVVQEPDKLASLRPDNLRTFTRQFQHYSANGGAARWTDFVHPAVLVYLRTVEHNGNTPDDAIFSALVAQVAQDNRDISQLERKFMAITIDPEAESSVDKVKSILLGMESVMNEMGLSCGNSGTDIHVPLATHIGIVLSKLPLQLKARVEKRMKFLSAPKTKHDFAKLVLEESATYQWPRSGGSGP